MLVTLLPLTQVPFELLSLEHKLGEDDTNRGCGNVEFMANNLVLVYNLRKTPAFSLTISHWHFEIAVHHFSEPMSDCLGKQ